MEPIKTHQIVKVLFLSLVILFITLGCEREHKGYPDLTASSEQTQSVTVDAEDEELEIIIEKNVPVPMRDGTILRADVHRPDRGGPYPVLVYRTQYGARPSFERFVKAGYIVVIQDVRGSYDSEGEFESIFRVRIHDGEDGYDTVEWAAELPGSTGKVGVFGGSDPGMRLWNLAALCPPSLKAMCAMRCLARTTDATKGTLPPLWVKHGFVTVSPESRRRSNLPGVNTRWEATTLWEEEKQKWLWWLPWNELPQEIFEDETDAIKYLLKNPHLDLLKLDECCHHIIVPNLAKCGWYDHTFGGDILLFQKMAKEANSEVACKGTRIILGPWGHGSYGRRVGNIDFGPNAEIEAGQIRWFDYWLKGIQNGVDKDPTVRIFVMGDNQWRDELNWPLLRAKDSILYITSDGNANTPEGNGYLIEKESNVSGTDQYKYDPMNPVPSPYDLSQMIYPSDQRRLAEREDILVYQTEPLTERTEVTGIPVVELYASSSAADTDWIVRLIDVYPDGSAIDVSHGFLRARYRHGFDKPELIEPGEIIQYTISMRPTSNAFLPGHRIRLDITSSDFPNYDRNHNTATDQNADATLVTANQTIYHCSKYATRIILPWIPNPVEQERQAEEERHEAESQKQTYPLHQAAINGNTSQIKLLLSQGVDINAKDENTKTPLHYAVEADKIEVVKLLVEAGADIEAEPWTPLYIAISNGYVVIAEYLIDHGANIHAPEGWTAWQQAPYSNSVEMIKMLIAKGADVNRGPWTALHSAVDGGSTEIAELLIQSGASINVEENGMPLSHLVLSMGEEDMVELFLLKGADFAWKDQDGRVPLHFVVMNGYKKITKQLLSKGVTVDERDDVYEFTALHYAARFGHKEIAEFLIAHGADIKAKDKWGYQPIHWAAYHDRPEIIELLIAKGADVNVKTSLGETPLELAIPRRNTAAIEVLKKKGAKE